MPYRLRNGVYSVRCRYHHCPFNAQMKIEQTIMGMTESDVESEARKVARDMAAIAHDAIRVRQHPLHNPEIRRSSGSCQLIGADSSRAGQPPAEFGFREFSRGQSILREGEQADCVCEVLRGSAYPEGNKSHRYRAGDCFGAAGLVPGHKRMTSVTCASDGTRIVFHNLARLSKSDPRKAQKVFARVIEDTLEVIQELEKKAG